MNVVAIVWLIIGVITLVVLAVFMVSFVRQVQRLSSSVVQFQKEIKPVLESIQRDADAAQEHSARLQDERQALREARADGGKSRSRARARR